jgi:hypothetical protein
MEKLTLSSQDLVRECLRRYLLDTPDADPAFMRSVCLIIQPVLRTALERPNWRAAERTSPPWPPGFAEAIIRTQLEFDLTAAPFLGQSAAALR